MFGLPAKSALAVTTAATAPYDVIPTHVTDVVGVRGVGAAFVRITFGGGLERFAPVGPDQFVYVLVQPPGCDELAIGTDFRWSAYESIPIGVRPVGAYYTVRGVRPAVGELDVDVFLHDPAGPASGWAASRAIDGAPAALWGPRTAWSPPPDTTRWLLVADDTGLPATEVILESLPAAADVTVVADLGHDEDIDRLRCAASSRSNTALVVHRRSPDAGGTTDVLVDALRSLDLAPDGLYAWGGAESRAMRDVRLQLRHEVGLSREQVSMTPYWRHARHADDAPDVDD